MKDANRTPVLNVAYGDRFRLNAHDVRTQAIVHPKVFGTTGGGSTSNFANISKYGQTQQMELSKSDLVRKFLFRVLT